MKRTASSSERGGTGSGRIIATGRDVRTLML